MKRSGDFLGLIVIALFFSACGKYFEPPSRTTEYSMNEVKLISKSIGSPDDNRTFLQEKYTVGPEDRLLLAYDVLLKHANDVIIEDKEVVMNVTVVDVAALEIARSSIQICPVTSRWVILATWRRGHPFSAAGIWHKEGGDFDANGCVTAMPAVVGAPVKATLSFDMTNWFRDYVRARTKNDGLIIVSTQSVSIVGDRNGSYSPRITFTEYLPKKTL